MLSHRKLSDSILSSCYLSLAGYVPRQEKYPTFLNYISKWSRNHFLKSHPLERNLKTHPIDVIVQLNLWTPNNLRISLESILLWIFPLIKCYTYILLCFTTAYCSQNHWSRCSNRISGIMNSVVYCTISNKATTHNGVTFTPRKGIFSGIGTL